MAVGDGIVIGDTPRVFCRGEIAASHQPNECNWKLCVCVCVSFLLLVRSCRDFAPTNGGLIPSWSEEPTSVHSTGQYLLEVITTSSRGLTNSAHDTGVVRKNWKGELHERTGGEIFVKQQLGWNWVLAERMSPFIQHMPMWSRSERGKSWRMCEVLCSTPSA